MMRVSGRQHAFEGQHTYISPRIGERKRNAGHKNVQRVVFSGNWIFVKRTNWRTLVMRSTLLFFCWPAACTTYILWCGDRNELWHFCKMETAQRSSSFPRDVVVSYANWVQYDNNAKLQFVMTTDPDPLSTGLYIVAADWGSLELGTTTAKQPRHADL